MVMDQADIDRMQEIQLELLLEVDRICKKHQITYGIVAGTLLGAVRHKGFIPWDKDVDIGMVRKEYDKFLNVCETELDPEEFYVQDYRLTDGYRWGYGRLRRRHTYVFREGQEFLPYGSGVGIDLFPLDHVPEALIPQVLHHTFCAVIRKFTWCHVGKKTEKKASLRLLYSIMDLVPEATVKQVLTKWIAYSNRKETPLVRILMFPTLTQYRYYYKKWYVDVEPIDFEGCSVMGAKDYHGYLSFKFGDYMTPPPLEEQTFDRYSYWNFHTENLPLEIASLQEEERKKMKYTN